MLSYEHKLKQREYTLNDLERDTSYFRGKDYFGNDGMQNYFVFQPMYKITGNQKDYQMERLMFLAHQVVMIKCQF